MRQTQTGIGPGTPTHRGGQLVNYLHLHLHLQGQNTVRHSQQLRGNNITGPHVKQPLRHAGPEREAKARESRYRCRMGKTEVRQSPDTMTVQLWRS